MPAMEAKVVLELPQDFSALYVGDLDSSVTEEELRRFFNQAGGFVSVKLCTDLLNQQSLGYGYVNYANPDDAEKAMDALNFTHLNGKCIRIAFFRRPGTQTEANLFVKNLDQTINHKGLHEIFSPYGKIMSCKVETDSNGQSKGYGYVQYKHEESAATAIQHLHSELLLGKELHVVPYRSKQEREAKFTNVFVKNISAATTEEDLMSIFGEFGSTTSVVVMRDEEGSSKCFGFVNFENAADAARSVDELNGREFNGKEWFVGRAKKKVEREKEIKLERERIALESPLDVNNVYIKNIDDDIDSDKLNELFSPFGTITSCKVMTDKRGISRGYGFVAYSTGEAAARAISEMNGKMIGRKPFYVRTAERKEARRQRLQAPMVPNFMHPMVQHPSTSQPAHPLMHMHPQMPLRGFRSSNGTISQGATPTQNTLASALVNAPPHDQKNMLGAYLYPLVQVLEPVMAGRVTGMLLEMDQTEVLHLLESPQSLVTKVMEAVNVLANASQYRNWF
ncbi:polyadenylate-binding protein 4-like isoform X2 [Salvia splendens]|uniref:polyadenylate-binding protein 4-like isoform X2 n=1 Tax=Salvia splendens TaxID=180675 RepID=UPI001C2794EF|nr:polyadenylate-binding protein 4-like isoform X2 [Salvia splendens]